MGITLRQTSCSPIFNEGNDYSCAMFDARARLVSHGEFLPIHLGSLPFSVRFAIEAFGIDDFEPGDAVLLNDPLPRRLAPAGHHARDADLRRRRLVGFAANRAHHLDIGGTVAGSFYAQATENYQEGLRITAGQARHGPACSTSELLSLLDQLPAARRQMRMDLQSQVSANLTAAARMPSSSTATASRPFAEAWSLLDTLGAAHAGEHRELARRRLRRRRTHGQRRDHGRAAEIRVTVAVRRRRARGRLHRQLAQVDGPLNSVLGYTHAGVYMTFQAATDPDILPNSGCYRPIANRRPEGTIVNPRFPAACTGGNEITSVIHNAVFRALVEDPARTAHVRG